MSDDPNLEQPLPDTESAEAVPPVPPKPRSRVRRAGCIIAAILWFFILLLPCFLIVLAVNQEIAITTGSAPGQQLRLWLISEAEQRGLAVSNASVHQSAENAICVKTTVNYYLWAGSEEPSVYCDCYERATADASWSYTTSTEGTCRE